MESLILALMLCFAQSAGVQNPDRPAQAAGANSAADYRIGPGDVLYISVLGMNELNQTIRISNSGKIHVPHLGVMKVNDKTPSELEALIAAQLVQRELVKKPWVQVRVVEYRAHPVYILGEVMQPGQFLMKDEMYLSDLISLAAGFNDVATPVGYLYRRAIPQADAEGKGSLDISQSEEAIEIDFRKLYDGSKPELNVKLRGGDVLYVPQRKQNYYFVVGDIQSPKAYEISFQQEILASQAIAKAGGPLKTAKLSKSILVRYEQDGSRKEQTVDFGAILKGRKPDFPVRPNDIIFIPGSSAKTLGYGLLGVLPSAAAGVLLF
jgi:polysaccharide biosynthesis/export protein